MIGTEYEYFDGHDHDNTCIWIKYYVYVFLKISVLEPHYIVRYNEQQPWTKPV